MNDHPVGRGELSFLHSNRNTGTCWANPFNRRSPSAIKALSIHVTQLAHKPGDDDAIHLGLATQPRGELYPRPKKVMVSSYRLTGMYAAITLSADKQRCEQQQLTRRHTAQAC